MVKRLNLRGSRYSMIRFQSKDGKWVFIDADEQARFLGDDVLKVAKIEENFVNNLAFLLEDIAKTDEEGRLYQKW